MIYIILCTKLGVSKNYLFVYVPIVQKLMKLYGHKDVKMFSQCTLKHYRNKEDPCKRIYFLHLTCFDSVYKVSLQHYCDFRLGKRIN